MYKNFNLYIDVGKKPIELPVHIDKMTDPKTSLRTGYRGGLVKQVLVLPKDGIEEPRSLEDIQCVVSRSETQSVYCHQKPDGATRFIAIEKDMIKKAFPISRNITVICSLPISQLKPYMFDGTHYHLSLYGTLKKKVKVIDPADKRMFNILFHGLNEHDSCFIAKFISFNREKCCAIYPDSEAGFVMSNLIPSNYFRTKSVDNIVKLGELADLINAGLSKRVSVVSEIPDRPLHQVIFQRLHESLTRESLDGDVYKDRYEDVLRQLITRKTESDEPDLILPDMTDVIVSDGELDSWLGGCTTPP